MSFTDYYPFGMEMPGRHASSENYRYGFQGQERDDEVKGQGNSYTTEFRQYDPRLGKWLSLDPMASSFPWQSPYVAYDNNPIYYVDPKGLAAGGPGKYPGDKATALYITKSWASSGLGYTGMWNQIKATDFAYDLYDIINHPYLIRQGKTPWCGAACANYIAATLDPLEFATIGRYLYMDGFVEGKGWLPDYDASDDLYNESSNNKAGIHNAATFVMLTTFKNNYKGFGWDDLTPKDYSNNIIGITYPMQIRDYLTNYYDIDYKAGGSRLSGFNKTGWEGIEGVYNLMVEGYQVPLIVNAHGLDASSYSDSGELHYIVPTSMSSSTINGSASYTVTYYDPNKGSGQRQTYTEEEWNNIIYWYGGYKKNDP